MNFDGMDFNPMDLLKNAGQLKQELEKATSELSNITATGSAGGGLVKITLNGKFEITELNIDPIAVDPRDVKMLEDIIVAAFHQACENIKDEMKNACPPQFRQFF